MRKIISILGLAVAVGLMVATGAMAAHTVVVSGDTAEAENEPGWMFNRDDSTSTPFEFSIEEASIGSGSLYVLPIANDSNTGKSCDPGCDKFIAENFLNESMADVNSISYDFLIGDNGAATDSPNFYMNVYANFAESDDDKFYDCRYDLVPPMGTIGEPKEWTTMTFDPTASYPVTQRNSSPHDCPAIPAEMDDQGLGANIRMFSLNVGDTSTNDNSIDGYLDNVVVDVANHVTTYDFELDTKAACRDGGWMEMTDDQGNSFENQGKCIGFFQRR